VRILHVDTERGWRGGEQQLLYLVKGLQKLGVESTVACRAESELFRRCLKEGIEVIPLKGNQLEDLFRLGVVGKEFELVHAHSAKAHTVCAFSKKFYKKPLIYTRRVDYLPRRNRLTELKYRVTDKVVAISQAVKEVLKERFNQIEPVVIPSAVDVNHLYSSLELTKVEEIRKKLNGKPLIGTLAALTEQKDIPNFIRAAKVVKGELPGAKFVVFGEGKKREELKRLIEKEGLEEDFILFGFVSEVANYTKALDLFVLPSENEGLGSSILIAMALKVPVVATKVGGTVEAVIDGKTGILVPPKRPEALARGILKLAKSERLRKELSENAFLLVKEKFSVESMVNSYLKVYREVLERWKRPGTPSLRE
jgi:glycosyltransferase involved in cell wall biosynthesis